MEKMFAASKKAQVGEEKRASPTRAIGFDSRGHPHAREIATGLFTRITRTLKSAFKRLFGVEI